MATGSLHQVVRHLHGAALLQGGGAQTDADLLGRFLAGRDEAAFAALVRRYGAMLLGVGQRLMHDAHAGEDAFQATFLILTDLRSVEMPGSRSGPTPMAALPARFPLPLPCELVGGAEASVDVTAADWRKCGAH
jgi:hypothetical protein